MKSIIRTGILTLAVFVSFGFPAASKADYHDWMIQSDPNAGYVDWYIPEAPPTYQAPPTETVTISTPPIETVEYSLPPTETVSVETPPFESATVSTPPLETVTSPNYVDRLAPEYPIYGSYPSYGYPGYGFGGPSFGLGFGLGFGPSFTSPAFFSSPAIIQPAVISQPSVASASASATAVASVTNVNTVSAPPQYAAQYIAPTYVTPTYYTPPVQYTAQYIPPPQPIYQPPVTPYVALTQIPYTGFDLGPVGNALYWLSLVGFAAAGAYLVVYYLPALKFGSIGSMAFAGGILSRNRLPAGVTYIPAPTPANSRGILEETPKDSRAAYGAGTSLREKSPRGNYGGTKSAFAAGFGGTQDEMVTIASSDGISAPRIVITRT